MVPSQPFLTAGYYRTVLVTVLFITADFCQVEDRIMAFQQNCLSLRKTGNTEALNIKQYIVHFRVMSNFVRP